MLTTRLYAPQVNGGKFISRGKDLVIPAMTGSEPLATPRIRIQNALPKEHRRMVWSAHTPSTPETPVAVFEMCKDRTIMAACFGEPEEYCFDSPLQITGFCENYPTWLRGDWPTLFAFRAANRIFFADVYLYPDGNVEIIWDDINFPMKFAACHTPWLVAPKRRRVRVR